MSRFNSAKASIVWTAVALVVEPSTLSSTVLMATFLSSVSYAKSAKDFSREGEILLKSNDPLGAHRAFTEAVKLDDKNKKYRRSLLDAGRLVSESGFKQAQSQLSSNPQAAFDGFKSALYFDSENKKAAEALAALEAEVGEANLKIVTNRKSLDLARVKSAVQLLQETSKFKSMLTEYGLLEGDIASAKRLIEAESNLTAGDPLAAAKVLGETQLGRTTSDRLRQIQAELRSATIAESEKLYVSSKPGTLHRARAAAIFQFITDGFGTTKDSEAARIELRVFLEGLKDRGLSLEESDFFRHHPRVLLQTLETLFRDTTLKAQAQALFDAMKNSQPRSIRLRFRGPSKPSCSILTTDAIRGFAIRLANVVLVEDDDYDLAVSIADLSCQEPQNPRVAVRIINSTYVAGQSQTVNPEYAQLKARLEAVQMELSRIERTPNSAVSVGMYQGAVMGLQRRLLQTPPFLSQNIEQAYQLQEFVSKRQVYIKAAGTYLIHVDEIHGGKELLLEADQSSEGSGRSGSLPQDRRYSNSEPQLKSFEELRRNANDEFERKFRLLMQQAICDLIVLKASNEKSPELARMDWMLQLADKAEGTTYSAQKGLLIAAVEARLLSDGSKSPKRIGLPTGVTKPDLREDVATHAPEISVEGVAGMIDRILDGVVAIETDAGSSGSGFFASKDCQVLSRSFLRSFRFSFVDDFAARKRTGSCGVSSTSTNQC